MKSLYTLLQLAFFLLAMIVAAGCDYEEVQATDLITGEVDLDEAYAKANMTLPTMLQGKIIDRATNLPLKGANIVARMNYSDKKYSTTSKADGSFTVYVEGNNDYVIKAEKEGFEKSYYRDNEDTILSISNYWNYYDLRLSVKDNLPTLNINFQNNYSTNMNLGSLTFNGTHIVGNNYSYCYYFNKQAVYVNYSYLPNSFNFISYKDTLFYAGYSSSKTISQIGRLSGKVYSNIYLQIPTTTIKDMDVFYNHIWVINNKQIMKLTETGSLVSTIDLQSKVFDLNLVGIGHNNSHLFVINKASNAENSEPKYMIYKIDPADGNIVAKGILPQHLEDFELTGLTFDNASFWTANNSYYSSSLIKFSITE